MGSLHLVCPMCCGETFDDSQSLKYHLLSMTDNLYCPGCSQRSDSVMALIQHLDRCGQEPDLKQSLDSENKPQEEHSLQNENNVLVETHVGQIDESFIATVNEEGIVIVGGPRTIEVDENGQINVIEKMDSGNKENSVNAVTVKQVQKQVNVSNKQTKETRALDPLFKQVQSIEAKPCERNNISILPDASNILDESSRTLIGIDGTNEVQELDEAGLLQVKQELSEIDSDSLYSCSSCGMSFNSVLDHIKQYHDGQEVVLEMAEQQLDDFPATVPSPIPEDLPPTVNARQRQTMNTLRTEECVDSEGRLYTRKVVQIERFWDRPPKAPMIEKFFSNVEGVKVRDKNVASAPTKVYRCNQCFEQFDKLGDFRVHACLHGNNQCDHCDQTFATIKALQMHAKSHEGELDGMQRAFVCTSCGTEFSSHKSLRLHSRMHAPVRARHVEAPEGIQTSSFTCRECGKTFSESYKSAHMALHSGDSATCTICNRKFDSADSLAMHAAVHTELSQTRSPTPPPGDIESNQNLKPYQCQHCSRRFTRPHEKVKHERIHTGEKPHACEVCGKTFRVSYCLTLHMRTHTGVRPYACQHCGKRFKASSVYNHHLLTHGEERAYTCPYCPKTFKTRVQLAGHKNSHTKPFRCTECSRPFASLYAARAHIQTHKKDNNLKFSCYVCGASYGRAFALKDHLKQHSQDVLAPPEPAREEEVHEGEDFFLAEEEVEDDELVIPSPLPVAQSSEADDTD
ncbi:zinc finger protein 2 isoform X2 [Orussus abietinus]|uniref:zinc finger protein 2 isoform X2 n=1 Tax=Orussus abietinus TaxID=222816 RepID=UPI000625C0AC|nr:zinc finger protein 2 isoform X2 [Orussus abietinus]